VLFSGGRRCCGYGLYVDVQHENGYVTRYAHLSSSSVRPGDTVASGTAIGVSGDTGRSSGPHLHFELRWSGYALNPLSYLP
jgi:murein DD-endopeptidase MepM/ murein hydrolase activator NlpD